MIASPSSVLNVICSGRFIALAALTHSDAVDFRQVMRIINRKQKYFN
jgi:hypothetical protein